MSVHVCVRTHLGVLHVSMYTCMSAHVHVCGGEYNPHFLLKLTSQRTGETGSAGRGSVAAVVSAALPLVLRCVPA